MNSIICPHCKQAVEISEAITQQMREELLEGEAAKYKIELEKTKTEAEERVSKLVREEFEFKLKNTQQEAEDSKQRMRKLHEELLQTNKEKFALKQKDEERELEMQRQLAKEREKISSDVSRIEQEKSRLEKMDMQKKLDDMQKALEEAQRKGNQSSQQLQGEVLELELESMLRSAFPHDEIISVSKGISGADIKHVVKSPRGITCGMILWEFKRTKDWSDKWIPKLKEDLRSEKADIPVIVSIDLPKEAESGFGQKDGVVICGHELVIPVAMLLRKNLLDVGYQKAVSANKGEKAEQLHSYVTGREFLQHIENIAEAYREQMSQIIKEKAAFQKIWKSRETQAQRIVLSAASIYGSMQGIVGGSMAQVKGLELDDLAGEEEQIGLLDE